MKTFNFYFAITILMFSITSCLQFEDKTEKQVSNDDQITLNSNSPNKINSTNNQEGSTIIQGDFVHMVFFWLKEPDNKAVKEKFTNSLIDFVKNSDDIKSYHLGTPADTYRPIIDTSYTYCLIVTFPSKVEHDSYQIDPVHKKFLKNFKDSWEKVQIYDSESIK